MKHWLTMSDYEPDKLARLARLARQFKAGKAGAAGEALRNRILVMVFFNPSLRTRTSFEAALLRHGGHAITLSVGGDTWKLEHRDGAVMDADKAEHIREAAPVLSRYGDLLAVRTFAGLKDAAEDAADPVLRSFARFATVPVINMESAIDHPCQGLGDWMTMDERLCEIRGRKFVLTWAPHVKPLPLAVSHSAVLAAAAAGMYVTIAHPPGYELNPGVMERAGQWCQAAGAKLTITHDQHAACRDANVVYAKSWGSPSLYGKPDAQRDEFQRYADWKVGAKCLGDRALLMHCLPVRRNVEVADDALDHPRCVVIEQAENRMWAQAAIMSALLRPEED